jgi:hypothetical protein
MKINGHVVKLSIIWVFLVFNATKSDPDITQPTPVKDAKEKRKLQVDSTSKTEKKERKLCPCKGGRKLEIIKSKLKERKLVEHQTGGVRRVDMYQGKPNLDTMSSNMISNEKPSPEDFMVGEDGQILAVDCCMSNSNELDVINEPISNPRPMFGLLSNLLRDVEKSNQLVGTPHVSGFIQMTKEHVLPNGQVEIERMNEPMQSGPSGMVFGQPQIQLGTPVPSHRMINPITGLLMMPRINRIPQRHEVIIAMSKPEVHQIEIPLIPGMGNRPLIPHPVFGNESILDRLIGDILMHHERPDVNVMDWHNRNSPFVVQPVVNRPEEDINNMLLGLMRQRANRVLKKSQKPVNVEMEMDIPLTGPSYQELRNQQISTKPDLNDLMGMISAGNMGQTPKITKSKKTKKRKLKKEKTLDNGMEKMAKVTKEQKFLNDLEHLGDSDKKLHKFKRKYKKYLTGLEKMYSKTSAQFKQNISKAGFMKRALKNKTLFKQFLIKDLRRRNRKLKRKLEKESKRLMNGVYSDLNDKLIG